MLKLLICLISTLILAALVLQLRQQRLELQYQTNALHNQIEHHKARLWSQQLEVAIYTAPNAIARTVKNHDLKLAPQKPLPAVSSHWMDVAINPDAE